MKYSKTESTYLCDGFPLTDNQVLDLLNSMPVQSHKKNGKKCPECGAIIGTGIVLCEDCRLF